MSGAALAPPVHYEQTVRGRVVRPWHLERLALCKVGRCRLKHAGTRVESAWFRLLKLEYDKLLQINFLQFQLKYDRLLSSFAFNFKLRHLIAVNQLKRCVNDLATGVKAVLNAGRYGPPQIAQHVLRHIC